MPASLRAINYLNQSVRRVSDQIAQVAAFPIDDADLLKGLQEKQREVSRFRQMVAHLVENGDTSSIAMAPPRRQLQKGG